MLFSLSVSLAPKMLKQNFMLESLRPAYTVLTFQSDYSPLYARCAQAKYKNQNSWLILALSVAFVTIPVVFFIISNVGLERKDTLLSKENAIKRFFTLKDVFCLDL